MNEILEIELREIGGKDYRCPVFKFKEDILSSILIHSEGNVRSLFLDKIDSIIDEVESEKINEKFEVIKDELSEFEKDLPVHLREDTGFNLGNIIHLQSYVHELYLYYRVEEDQIAIIHYKPKIEYQLRLFDRQYFTSLCEQWLRKLNKNNSQLA